MSDSDSDSVSSAGSIIEDVSEPDTTSFKCLFCDQQWGRVPDMAVHSKKEHGFDLNETIKSFGSGRFYITSYYAAKRLTHTRCG